MNLYHQTFWGMFPMNKDILLHIYNIVIKIKKFNVDMIILCNIVHFQVSNFINYTYNSFYSYFPLYFRISVLLVVMFLKLFFGFLNFDTYRMFLNSGLSDV